MPIPVEDYVMDPGVDPTSTFGGYAPTLNQMVSLETPNSYRGMTIYSTTTPAVTGQPTGYPTNWYAWNKRNLWINPTTGEISVYTTLGGWTTPGFALGTIDGAALADYTVDISKLDPGTSHALQIIRVKASGTEFEFIDPATLYAPGTFNISVITPGADGTMAVSSGGTTQWVNATTYIGTAIAPTIAGVISTAYDYTDASITDYDAGVQFGAIATQVYYFNGTSKVWGYADTLLRNGQVALAKLNVTAETGLNLLRVNAGHTAVESVPATVATAPAFAARQYATTVPNQITIDAGAPSPTGLLTFPHGLTVSGVATMPTKVRFVYVQVVARNGYAIGDEYPVELITFGTNSGNRGADTTNVYYYQDSNVGTVKAKNANTTAAYVNGDVRLKAYAEL